MATTTQTDMAVTRAWANLVVTNPDLASVDVAIQNKSSSFEEVYVVFGGSSPTDERAGFMLQRGESVAGNAAAIWLRSPSGGDSNDKVGVTLL